MSTATKNSGRAQDRSSLRQYFEEIGGSPLLTAKEEAALATKIQANGDEESRQTLMKSNLRLVVSIAKQYTSPRDPDLLLDLIQEGNIGLMKAVDRFDPTFKTRFSTYGVYWIRQAILRALKARRIVRLPENVIDRVVLMKRTRQQLYQVLGRWPTSEELAGEMKLPISTIMLLEEASTDVVSLDQPVRSKEGEDETRLGDLIEDTDTLGPSHTTQREILKDEIRAAVETLPPRERKLLEMRFGLADHDPYTLEDIGKEFGISRERVRQLQNVALSRLRQREGVKRVR